jgi:hypothetical protein
VLCAGLAPMDHTPSLRCCRARGQVQFWANSVDTVAGILTVPTR